MKINEVKDLKNNIKRINDLEDRITKAKVEYYNGQSKISDKVYDALIDELSELDPKNLVVTSIGSEPVSNWEKYTHKNILGSLNKCQTFEELNTWASKYCLNPDQFFTTLKLDGLSVSLIYENGVFVKGATRGGGDIGENISQNVAKMAGIPLRLNQKINATIRGEVLLSKENHQKFFPDYSNTRNAASGISRRYDGDGSDKLTVLVYQILTDDLEITTQEEQFKILNRLNFITPPFYLSDNTLDILKLRDDYTNSLRDKFEFDLDGLVVHNNDLNKIAQYGSTNGRDKGSIAFKFDSIAREAFVSKIEIQCGNSGRQTPVAVFSPKVNLMGAEIERASLHNFANIRELGIDVGCKVLVCRSNDVIPFVEEVVESTGTVFPTPTRCSDCGAPVMEIGEYIQCSNISDCPSQITGRIANWIKELDIKEWGDSVLEKLVASGKVNNIADLYKLTLENLAGLERMGKKSAKNCLDTLWAKTEIPLDVFLGGFSLQMIGSSTIRAVMGTGPSTLDQFFKLTISDLEKVPGVGPTKAKFLFDGLKQYGEVMKKVLDSGISITQKTEGKLSGKSFAFTGKMINKRADLESMVSNAGGEVKNGVGKNLSFLVIEDVESTSSKAQNARKFGTSLISEGQFLEMVK